MAVQEDELSVRKRNLELIEEMRQINVGLRVVRGILFQPVARLGQQSLDLVRLVEQLVQVIPRPLACNRIPLFEFVIECEFVAAFERCRSTQNLTDPGRAGSGGREKKVDPRRSPPMNRVHEYLRSTRAQFLLQRVTCQLPPASGV